MKWFSVAAFSFLYICTTLSVAANATSYTPPSNVVQESLADNMPLAIAPPGIRLENFSLKWDGFPQIAGVSVRIIPGSLQWVRVGELYLVPRATLEVSASSDITGKVSAGGISSVLVPNKDHNVAELPISLLTWPEARVRFEFHKGEKIWKENLGTQYHSETEHGPINLDVSCTRKRIEVQQNVISPEQWAYVSCRSVDIVGEAHTEQVQEVYVFWNNSSEPAKLNGLQLDSPIDGVNFFRSSPGQNNFHLQKANSSFDLEVQSPEETHRGNFSAGIGPYYLSFQGGSQSYNGLSALGSLYGSYAVSDTSRLIYFAEISGSPQLYSDFGFYYEFETAKAFDRRLSVNIMLGVHGAAFFATNSTGMNYSPSSYYGHFDAPQGFELVYTDPGLRQQSIAAGAFIEPSINGNSYYNYWLRWSKPKYFIELNYLGWTQVIDAVYQSTCTGITVGMPLLHFL